MHIEYLWQPTTGFMTHVTCRLTAKNREQLRNHMLGNRVWATFTFCGVYLSVDKVAWAFTGLWSKAPLGLSHST